VENEYGSVLIEDLETNYYRNGEWDTLIYVPRDEPVRIFAIASDEYLSGEYYTDELHAFAPDLVVSGELICLLSDLTEAETDDHDLSKTEIPDARAITEDNPIGETIVTYPQYMSPGSTGLVVLSIYVPIPPELFDVFPAEADPVDITRVEVIAEPRDDVPVGKSITYQGTIRVGETMIAKLESHNFSGIARQNPEQYLFLDGSRVMTTWLWDIEAPGILGKQNFTIMVWRDDEESNPIWRGDFEVEIIALTPVPSKTPISTATVKPSNTPEPTNTPVPTLTITLTPTKSIPEQISEGLIHEIPQLILWFLGILLLVLLVIVILYISKKSAIRGLESQLEESNDELEKIKIQEQIDIIQQQSLWKQFLEWLKKRVMGGE
jgi:hypothetical protein